MVISVVKRGSFGWLLVWLKRGSLGNYYCGFKGAVLGGH